MSGYYIMFNPKSEQFYPYGGNGLKYDGSSKQYVDNAIQYINKLEEENRLMKEQLKKVKVKDINLSYADWLNDTY